MARQQKTIEKEETTQYLRFNLLQRVEHWLFMASFTTLGVTGLVQKFASSTISKAIVNALGGIENTRLIHHWAAIIMLLVSVYHIGAVVYRLYVRRARMTMLPSMADVRAAITALGYNLGFRKRPPQQGRYGFEEKAEYWAVVWGTVVMAITGLMMWNPIATTKILPGEFIPAAKTAHGLEAILAVAAIILWHLYNVLIRTFNRSMYTGYLNEEQMLHEHPLELADIKAGTAARPLDPQARKQREKRFFPTFGVVAVALTAAIIYFVSFEETAIATVPSVSTIEVFAPLTPTPLPTPLPTATPAPIEAATWEAGIGELFNTKCGSCHGPAKMGGLDLTTYERALAGGNSGPGIVPEDPDNSQVVIIQAAGGHAGQFTEDELELIIQWTQGGAPEN